MTRVPPNVGDAVRAFRVAGDALDNVLDRGYLGSYRATDALKAATNNFGMGLEGAISATVGQAHHGQRPSLTTDHMYSLLRDYGDIKIAEGMNLLADHQNREVRIDGYWAGKLSQARNDAFRAADALDRFSVNDAAA